MEMLNTFSIKNHTRNLSYKEKELSHYSTLTEVQMICVLSFLLLLLLFLFVFVESCLCALQVYGHSMFCVCVCVYTKSGISAQSQSLYQYLTAEPENGWIFNMTLELNKDTETLGTRGLEREGWGVTGWEWAGQRGDVKRRSSRRMEKWGK